MKYDEILMKRRSVYGLGKNLPISDLELEKLIENAVKHTPSAFNSQSSRVVLLIGDSHNKMWDITYKILEQITPADKFLATKEKLLKFKNGYATILFYEDMETVNGLANKFPLYAQKFLQWSIQSSAMLQINIWNELASKSIGANLQHYNPLIDDKLKDEFNIDSSWELNAQMVIGSIEELPGEKEFIDINTRITVFK